MEYGISGRTAVVSGASRGMGRAIAEQLAKNGATVCILARNSKDLENTAKEIQDKTNQKIFFLAIDVSLPEAPLEVAKFINEKLGHIDILINNAGGPKFGNFMSLSESDWDQALQLSLRSTIRLTKMAIPYMQTRKFGRIVNITSTVAKEPTPTMILSATARAGVSAFAKALSYDLAPLGITINTVCPGGVLTDRLRSLLEARSNAEGIPVEILLEQSQKSIPIGRFATPEEFADYVTFLCSEKARYITGTCVSVDGGLTKGI